MLEKSSSLKANQSQKGRESDMVHPMLGKVLIHRTVQGLEGLCMMVTLWENGCTRVTIQPARLDKDASLQYEVTFDEQDFDDTGRTPPFPVRREAFLFQIGDIVRAGYACDFVGRVVALSERLDSPPRIGVRPMTLTPDGEPPKDVFISQLCLELIQQPAEPKLEKPSGGPRESEPTVSRTLAR